MRTIRGQTIMILEKTPLTLVEVKEYIKDSGETNPTLDYLKKFIRLNKEKSKQLKEEIIKLNNSKIKEENIVKIIDFLPKGKEEVNKIFIETDLTEEETNEILQITQKY